MLLLLLWLLPLLLLLLLLPSSLLFVLLPLMLLLLPFLECAPLQGNECYHI